MLATWLLSWMFYYICLPYYRVYLPVYISHGIDSLEHEVHMSLLEEALRANSSARGAGTFARTHPLSKRARGADRLLPATTTTVLSPYLSPPTTGPSLEWPWITESPGMHPSNVAAAVLLTFEQLSRRHSADFDQRVHAKREGSHANTDGRTPATELV